MKKALFLLLLSLLELMMANCSSPPLNTEKILHGSWAHYKRTFIKKGRVVRPRNNNDTVSEGESYAMIRAVVMGDKKTFDDCLEWTEANLSRNASTGDRLLAWHYEHGKISDITPASDADIDYGYALILAYRKWHKSDYLTLARGVMQSILDHETVVVDDRLYLLPYMITGNVPDRPVAQNLSYYAPSTFKLFYEISEDKRWLDLAETGYNLVGRLQHFSVEGLHPGLVPDWCALGLKGEIMALPGKPMVYGWDALRVPIRIAADYQFNRDPRALAVLRRFSLYFENEFKRSGKIPDENPLFYTAAYSAAESAGSSVAQEMFERQRASIMFDEEECFYNEPEDYYANSVSWLAEYYQLIKEKRK